MTVVLLNVSELSKLRKQPREISKSEGTCVNETSRERREHIIGKKR